MLLGEGQKGDSCGLSGDKERRQGLSDRHSRNMKQEGKRVEKEKRGGARIF